MDFIVKYFDNRNWCVVETRTKQIVKDGFWSKAAAWHYINSVLSRVD